MKRIWETDLGEQLKAIRLKKGLSLREMARRIGVTPQTLVNIEKGHTRPQWTTLDKICEELNVRIEIKVEEI